MRDPNPLAIAAGLASAHHLAMTFPNPFSILLIALFDHSRKAIASPFRRPPFDPLDLDYKHSDSTQKTGQTS